MNHMHDDSDFLKTLTLLYVEDDPDTCAQLAKFLRQCVATLITAASGAAGLVSYHTYRPAIVITDIQMPGMDGLTMAKKNRSVIDHISPGYTSGCRGAETQRQAGYCDQLGF